MQTLRPAVVACITQQASIREMARDLLTRHSGRLILAGHSLGGRVALEMARMAPGRIAGMALLNTGTHPKREGEEAKRQAMIDLCNRDGMAALAAQWVPGMMNAEAVPDPQVIANLTAMVCRMTPEIHERQLRALLARPDAAATLDYQGPMEIIEDAGHFAPVEQPDSVARLLADWAQGVADRDAGQDRIPDTPLFDRPRANLGYALNKMAMSLSSPEGRAAFLADEAAYLNRFELSEEQRAAVARRDWAEMVRLGGNLFYILKISAVDPTPIRAIGAAQAGMSLDAFLDTRLGKVTNG